jgi:serine/threonine protein kinase
LKPHAFARIDQPLDMIDLIAICLHPDPARRYTAAQLLCHPFLEMGAEDEDGQDPFLNQYIKLVPLGEVPEQMQTEQAWDDYLTKKLAPLYGVFHSCFRLESVLFRFRFLDLVFNPISELVLVSVLVLVLKLLS